MTAHTTLPLDANDPQCAGEGEMPCIRYGLPHSMPNLMRLAGKANLG